MKSRDQREQERRAREAAWAAEDAALNAQSDWLAEVQRQAHEDWEHGRSVFIARTVIATMQVRMKDVAAAEPLLADLVETVEAWRLEARPGDELRHQRQDGERLRVRIIRVQTA